MSTDIKTIEHSGTKEVDLSILQFSGGKKGRMLQLTQGLGGAFAMKQLLVDEPGYIQITQSDAVQIIDVLSNWISRGNKEFLKIYENND